ncbi:hypothetical protein ZWY2020_042649 [Hordeum vulgare]|nr:hypothetical protein ZWY2020_042649 [Hordeum vulgare]
MAAAMPTVGADRMHRRSYGMVSGLEGVKGYTPPPPVLASANPRDVQSYAKPPPVSVPAFTEVPLSVPAVAGLNLRRLILCRPSHDASAPAFFPSTTSYPSYDHRFPTLMDVTLVVGAREKGAACVDGTPPGYHWL